MLKLGDRRLVVIIAVAAGVVAALVLWRVVAQDEPSSAASDPDQDVPPSITALEVGDDLRGLVDGWLEPADEIRIGDHRYVQPCRLVSSDDVVDVFGESPELVTSEDYVDEEFVEPDQMHQGFSLLSHCQHFSEEVHVLVMTDQYVHAPEALRQWSDRGRGGRGNSLDALVRQMDLENLPEDAPEEVAELVQRILDSRDALAEIDHWEDDPADYVGGVLPVEATGTSSRLALFTGDGYVELLISGEGRGDIPTHEDLADYAELLDLVAERWSDEDLSQAPAPTFVEEPLAYGDTPLLEPCHVFTAEMFTQVYGVRQTETVSRRGYAIDLAGTEPATGPSAQCTRGFRLAVLPGSVERLPGEQDLPDQSRLDVALELRTAGDEVQADELWAGLLYPDTREDSEDDGVLFAYEFSDDTERGTGALRVGHTLVRITVTPRGGLESVVNPETMQELLDLVAQAVVEDLASFEGS